MPNQQITELRLRIENTLPKASDDIQVGLPALLFL